MLLLIRSLLVNKRDGDVVNKRDGDVTPELPSMPKLMQLKHEHSGCAARTNDIPKHCHSTDKRDQRKIVDSLEKKGVRILSFYDAL
jgi:hypothetical protein